MTLLPTPRDDRWLRETAVGEHVIYRGRYLSFRVVRVRNSAGHEHDRELVDHPGAVAILPVDGNDILLVRQWRHATGGPLLEIPAGTLDRLPDGTVEPPDACAARELAEETGLEAARWQQLGAFWTAPGFTNEYMHLYLAQGLSPTRGDERPDPDERLELVRLPWREALAAAEAGEIHDAKTLVGLFRLGLLAERGDLGRLDAPLGNQAPPRL
ncbi:MAG: NUDIX hydrolase [Candidatus Limnocylindrales bacterium]